MSEYRTAIYRYGLLSPIDWDKDCHEQLWKRNALWNRLVEIEHEHRKKYVELMAARPEVAPLEARMQALLDMQKAQRDERKRIRQAARKKAETGALDESLRALAREMEPLRAQLKAARTAARETVTEELRRLNEERTASVNEAAKTSGIYWCGYNAVLNSYDVARSKAIKEGAELRFHRFEGEGAFDVQFIGGVHADELCAQQHAMAFLDLAPQTIPGKEAVVCADGKTRGGRQRPRLSITAYMKEADGKREHRKLTFPIVLDRPLPEILWEGRDDARIQEITVTRRRCGTRFHWHAIFKLRMPLEATPVHPNPEKCCALNLGFRERPDGSLRVAMLYDGERNREIALSKDWRARMAYVEHIRSERDMHLDSIVAYLRTEWPNRPPGAPQVLNERITSLLRAPRFAAGKLAARILLWRAEFFSYWPVMRDALEAWRRADKHWYEIEANAKRKALAHREDIYRQLARELVREYGEIRIGAIDLKEMAKIEKPNGEETELHARARRNRHEASLYQLQQELTRQAVKTGCERVKIDAPYTPICATCGQSIAVDADLIVTCPQGHVWDQDELAARNIFAVPRERSSDEQNTGERSQQPKQRLTRTERMRAARARRREGQRSQRPPQAPDVGGI